MSKIKLSFSLIIALLLVGIISTAAFARAAYSTGIAADGSGGFKFTFAKISTDTSTSFNVDVYSQDPITKEWTVELKAGGYPKTGVDTTTTQTVNVPSTDGVKVGTVYKFALSNSTGTVGVKFGVLTDSNNLKMASIADDPEGLLDVNGSGLANANHTGTNDNTKKPNQNTHGFYQNNTNSCSSCHQTHTAANGEYLLFKDGTYSTCSACHDGTTGAYNSFQVATEETTESVAGTFNVNTTDKTVHNGSLHQADGSIIVSAAPGGNNASDKTAAIWGGEFDCGSCHTAHGSGSAAENNLNMDPLGWGGIAYSKVNKDKQNGKLFKDLVIETSVPTELKTPYIIVKKLATATDVVKDKTKYSSLYARAGVKEGDKILQTYRWDGSKYVADYSLWLRATGHVSAPFENANTFFTGATGDVTKTLNVVWRDGFAFGDAATVDAVTKAQISIGIDVETTEDIATLYDSANENYIYDSGTEMSKYCASCHVDYLSTTRTNVTGNYTTAHRHATAQDRLTCVRCHYAHGSDASIMRDANDETYYTLTEKGVTSDNALKYLVDVNPSSALKRYTGMSVCFACHGHGEQFQSNPNINHVQKNDPVYGRHAVDNSAPAGDWLKDGQPGTTRTDRTDINPNYNK